MKTTITLVIALIIGSIQIISAQTKNHICETEKVILASNSTSIGGVSLVDDSKTYVFEPGLIVVFQPEWEYAPQGRLVAFNSEIDCIVYSKENSATGWSMIIPNEELIKFKSGSSFDEIFTVLSIRFTDENNGWATATINNNGTITSVILHTKDGGLKWMIQFKGGSAMKLNNSCFEDSKQGIITGYRKIGTNSFNIVLLTNNGGLSWEEYNPELNPQNY